MNVKIITTSATISFYKHKHTHTHRDAHSWLRLIQKGNIGKTKASSNVSLIKMLKVYSYEQRHLSRCSMNIRAGWETVTLSRLVVFRH